jgi:hypothetical protein
MCKKKSSNRSSTSKINIEKTIYGIALGLVGLFLTTNGLFLNNIDETNSRIDEFNKETNRKIERFNEKLVAQTQKIQDQLSKTGGSVGDIKSKIERSFAYLNENFDAIGVNFKEIKGVIYKELGISVPLTNNFGNIRNFRPIPQKKSIILEDNIGNDDGETDQNLRARIKDGVLDFSGKDRGFVFLVIREKFWGS